MRRLIASAAALTVATVLPAVAAAPAGADPAVDGRAEYIDAAERYGEQAWSEWRDPQPGLFAVGGQTRLLDQAALVQLYAVLAQQPVTASP